MLFCYLVFFYTIENLLSIFIRNDGNPKLAMLGLMTTSILNIILNYLFIFVLGYGVTGCALATAISTILGMSVLCLHFFRDQCELKFVSKFFNWSDLKKGICDWTTELYSGSLNGYHDYFIQYNIFTLFRR